MSLSPAELIERKRDGKELGDEEIRTFVAGFTAGEVADYHASAFAMAVYFRGMSPRETAALTLAMADSGSRFVFPGHAPPRVDKHSTGGVGDKVSLVLAPLLACDEVWVPMVSGRGLGITGGTLDKLESIPGFRTSLGEAEALAQLEAVGVVMMGQTETFCPADRKLYALRDVTATVPSPPLIISSIMSKKIAESLDRLVLDVKYGSGAFMKSEGEARELAEGLAAVAALVGLGFDAVLTPMDEPLGHAVGNALEVAEAVAALEGGGPADLVALVLDLAEKVASVPRARLGDWLADGSARAKFDELVRQQGGDPEVLGRLVEDVHPARVVREVTVRRGGAVTRVDAGVLGRAAVALGAGRRRADDAIDPAVGFDRLVKVGAGVRAGDLLGRVHGADDAAAGAAAASLEEAVSIG